MKQITYTDSRGNKTLINVPDDATDEFIQQVLIQKDQESKVVKLLGESPTKFKPEDIKDAFRLEVDTEEEAKKLLDIYDKQGLPVDVRVKPKEKIIEHTPELEGEAQPTPSREFGKDVVEPVQELFKTLGTGMLASIASGLTGIGAGIGEASGVLDPGATSRTMDRVQQGLTYMPKTEGGKTLVRNAVALPLEIWEGLGNTIGDMAEELTKNVQNYDNLSPMQKELLGNDPARMGAMAKSLVMFPIFAGRASGPLAAGAATELPSVFRSGREARGAIRPATEPRIGESSPPPVTKDKPTTVPITPETFEQFIKPKLHPSLRSLTYEEWVNKYPSWKDGAIDPSTGRLIMPPTDKAATAPSTKPGPRVDQPPRPEPGAAPPRAGAMGGPIISEQPLPFVTEGMLPNVFRSGRKFGYRQPAPIEGTFPKTEPFSALPNDSMGLVLTDKELRNSVNLANEFYTNRPELWIDGATVTENLSVAITNGWITPETLARYNINPAKYVEAFQKSSSALGRGLAQLSLVARARALQTTPAQAKAMAPFFNDPLERIHMYLKELDRTRRSALISNISTVAAAAIGNAAKIGLNILQAPIDAALQRLLRVPNVTNPMDGLADAMAIFSSPMNRQVINNIWDSFPKHRDRLLMTTSATTQPMLVPVDEAVVNAMHKANSLFSWGLRVTERPIKSGIFQSRLSQELRNRGFNLEFLINKYHLDQPGQKINPVFADPKEFHALKESVKAATDFALESVWAAPPTSAFAKELMKVVENAPFLLTGPFPFFRYQFANALKFVVDTNPLGMLRIFTKGGRDRIAKGDTSIISKGLIGAGLFGLAVYIRNSEHAGPKFWELKTSALPEEIRKQRGYTGEEIIDLRFLGPVMVPQLFLADLMKRNDEGTLYELQGYDIANAFAGVNFRSGMGVYMIDNFLSGMSVFGDKPTEKAFQTGEEIVGELGSHFFHPFTQLKDLYDQLKGSMQVQRETRAFDPLTSPSINKIPGLAETLPPLKSPTRSTSITRLDPILSQLLSVRIGEVPNEVEKEMARFQITAADLYPKGVTREFGYYYAGKMGPLVEQYLEPVVRSQQYQSMSDAEKFFLFNRVRKVLQEGAFDMALADQPLDTQLKIIYDRKRKEMRLLLDDFGFKPTR